VSDDERSSERETLCVPRSVTETLRERADHGAPREICGVLVGARASGGERASGGAQASDGEPAADGETDAIEPARVTEAVAVRNVAGEPRTRYELDPEETLAVIERVEDAGDDVVGFYHSHPDSPPEPSAVDREAATWDGYVYLIVGPEELAAYRWSGSAFVRLEIEAVPES
jgi:proteasome lid subunit RPN8/RPN11